jgi:6-phosphogluconolactonase
MDRSRILKLIGLVTILFVVSAAAPAAEHLLYVGTYTGTGSEGIYAFRFDSATGETSSLGLAAATANPSFLAIDPEGRFLYAVNELEAFRDQPTGAVSAFAIDKRSGMLKLLHQVSSLGGSPAHLSLDRSARNLLVANYGGGNMAVFPVGSDGRLGEPSAFVQNTGSSVNPERQTKPHAHFIGLSRDNRLAITADLGLDKLLLHRFDAATGSLTPANPAFVTTEPGSGPRHVAFGPSGEFVYVLNELSSTTTVYSYNPDLETLHSLQTISTLPEGYDGANTGAEIVVDAAGRTLYVSNRGHDSIAVFSIDPDDGSLESLGWAPSGGAMPRNFVIDPTGQWLLTANQTSNSIHLLRIDPDSGRLTPTDRSLELSSPVCLRLVRQSGD